MCLGAVAVTLRFTSADQLLAAAERSVRAPLNDAATFIRALVPGYSFMASALFEEPDPKRQSELMEGVYAAKEKELHSALWLEDPTGAEVAEAYSSGGEHAGDFLLAQPPGASELPGKALKMAADEFYTAIRARLRVKFPAFLPRFKRVRGVAQHCNHQYSGGSTVCGHRLTRADGAEDTRGTHQQLCNVGGGVERRHNSLRDWLEEWLRRVCHLPWVDHEQHVPEWDKWVQARCPVTNVLRVRRVQRDGVEVAEPVTVLQRAVLDVAFRDDEGALVYVDVAYANASSADAAATLRAARTAGKAASEREDAKRRRYPPADNPHAELVPFVIEARGRLGAEVLPFLRQHAPAEEPLRSAVLARATRELSILTQRGLAALLLAAEPRPVAT